MRISLGFSGIGVEAAHRKRYGRRLGRSADVEVHRRASDLAPKNVPTDSPATRRTSPTG
jgi:hypothetical protein